MTSKIIRADGVTELTGIKSCVFKEQVNASVDLRPGCVASASIEVEVYGAQEDAPAAGEALTYYQVQDETETLIGTFFAEPSVPSRNTYAFVAYDAVSHLDADFSARLAEMQDSFPMTMTALLEAVEDVSGESIAGTNMLADTTAPTLTKVSAGADRYWSNAGSLSENGEGTEWTAIADSPVSGVEYGAKFVCTATGGSNHLAAFYNASIVPLVTGETYTLSMWAKGPVGAIVRGDVLNPTTGSAETWLTPQNITIDEADTWKKYSFTFQYNGEDEGSRVYLGYQYNLVGTVWCCAFQLERGTKATGWRMSPDEITVNAFYADGLTCRNIVSYAAEILCQYVHCDADGNILFDWYVEAENVIDPGDGGGIAYCQNGLDYANYDTAVLARVAVHPGVSEDTAYIYPDVAGGNTLNIQGNLLLTNADADTYTAVAKSIYNAMHDTGVYRPSTVHLFPFENPFRAGDIVSVTDIQGVTFRTLVMGMTTSASGASIESTGNEEYSDYESNPAKQITNLAAEIVQIDKLKVGWAEIDEAIIHTLVTNDITTKNLSVIDDDGNVIAQFRDTIVIGNEDSGHLEIDFNSMELYDKDGNTYVSIGDMRDANGELELTHTETATGRYFFVEAPIASIVQITVNGTEIPSSDYTFDGTSVAFNTAPTEGATVVIDYITTYPYYHFDLGERSSGTKTGLYSIVIGESNAATGKYSTVGGGQSNTADGDGATVSGGQGNSASDLCSIGGGYQNTASGEGATIAGGANNIANAYYATVGGGVANQSTGYMSTIPGGFNNRATHRSQFVFGECNTPDPSTDDESQRGNYVEIVGNGASPSNRSNARTLDWNGNEVLAGRIIAAGRDVLAEIDAALGANLLPTVYNRENSAWESYTSNGITWTVNPDGSVTANGTATAASGYQLSGATLTGSIPCITLDPDKRYTLSGCPSGGGASTYRIRARFTPDGTTPSTSSGTLIDDTGSGVTTTAAYKYAYVYCWIASGYTANNLTFYPMLEAGETAHGFVSNHDASFLYSNNATVTVTSGTADTARVFRAGMTAELNLITTGTPVSTDWATIATIPEGYRPGSYYRVYTGLAGSSPIECRITPAGNVDIKGFTASASATVWASFTYVI